MSSTSLRDSGVGFAPLPTNPVTPGRVAHDVPGVVVEVHAHEQVAGEDLLLHDDLAAVLELDDVFHRDDDLEDALLDVPSSARGSRGSASPCSRSRRTCARRTSDPGRSKGLGSDAARRRSSTSSSSASATGFVDVLADRRQRPRRSLLRSLGDFDRFFDRLSTISSTTLRPPSSIDLVAISSTTRRRLDRGVGRLDDSSTSLFDRVGDRLLDDRFRDRRRRRSSTLVELGRHVVSVERRAVMSSLRRREESESSAITRRRSRRCGPTTQSNPKISAVMTTTADDHDHRGVDDLGAGRPRDLASSRPCTSHEVLSGDRCARSAVLAAGALPPLRRACGLSAPCFAICRLVCRFMPAASCVASTEDRVKRVEQGRRDSNPQPPVLETGALPVELLPSGPGVRPTRG